MRGGRGGSILYPPGLGPSLGYHHTRPCLMITPKALDHALGELVRSVQTRQPPTRCAAR